jgi:hypothetical protein
MIPASAGGYYRAAKLDWIPAEVSYDPTVAPRKIMSIADFYWIPSAGVVTYEWLWLYAQRRTLKPFRTRSLVGIVGLILVTSATLGLLTAVLDNWVSGSFTWPTPFGGCGVFLALAAVPVGVASKGRLRLLTLASAALILAGWGGYLMARHVWM